MSTLKSSSVSTEGVTLPIKVALVYGPRAAAPVVLRSLHHNVGTPSIAAKIAACSVFSATSAS